MYLDDGLGGASDFDSAEKNSLSEFEFLNSRRQVYVASWTISYLDRACFGHGVW